MYEHHKEKVISGYRFYYRLFLHLLLALVLIAISLLIGMFGYHYFEHFDYIDSFLNASMILSGMGPAHPLTTHGGKIFAGFYAIYSGLLFISLMAILLIPVFHRLLHKFHVETKKD